MKFHCRPLEKSTIAPLQEVFPAPMLRSVVQKSVHSNKRKTKIVHGKNVDASQMMAPLILGYTAVWNKGRLVLNEHKTKYPYVANVNGTSGCAFFALNPFDQHNKNVGKHCFSDTQHQCIHLVSEKSRLLLQKQLEATAAIKKSSIFFHKSWNSEKTEIGFR